MYAVFMWKYYNNNPNLRKVGDCSIRAISVALNIPWKKAYELTVTKGYEMGDMPSSNAVIWAVLRQNGFKNIPTPDYCPECYTVRDFCEDNPYGTFVIFTSGHVVTAINGTYYDSWDSGNEIVLYVWYKRHKPVF